MRLNKFIASSGVCSRRKADDLISRGDVTINGTQVTEFGIQVNENKDIVTIGGKKIGIQKKKIYIMLNKPIGYITTNDEQFGRPMVLDLIHETQRVFPVGRLDMDTEGLLLLTNDGEFANIMMHPKNKVEKTYIVKIKEKVNDDKLNKIRNGIDIGDYVTKPAKVRVASPNELEIKISEGKNRQVRRMCEAANITVYGLKRVQIGDLEMGKLEVGKYKLLTKNDIKKALQK